MGLANGLLESNITVALAVINHLALILPQISID